MLSSDKADIEGGQFLGFRRQLGGAETGILGPQTKVAGAELGPDCATPATDESHIQTRLVGPLLCLPLK